MSMALKIVYNIVEGSNVITIIKGTVYLIIWHYFIISLADWFGFFKM